MNSDHNLYVEAAKKQGELLTTLNTRTLYEMVHHMRSRDFISAETACRFHEAILDKIVGRSIGLTYSAAANEKDFKEIFVKSQGLFIHYKKGELDAIFKELDRLKSLSR